MAVFERYREDLEAIFVVSDVRMVGLEGDAVDDGADASEWKFSAEFDIPGEAGKEKGTAYVMPPKQAKCPRCWRYVAPKEEELCGRCDVVAVAF
jgi:isoleucyl-tRNA synthetase